MRRVSNRTPSNGEERWPSLWRCRCSTSSSTHGCSHADEQLKFSSRIVVLDDGNRYIYGAHGLIAQVEGSDWYYFLSDGLGSTMAITDDVGTVVRDYTYDVFGEVTGGSGTVDSEFQFAGQQVDGSTGLQYLRARYYDMESGTFISRDPIAASPGWHAHPFTYVDGDPTNGTDPTGLWCWKFWNCPEDDDWPPPVDEICYTWIAYTSIGNCEEQLIAVDKWLAVVVGSLATLIGEYISPFRGGPRQVTGYSNHALSQAATRENYDDATGGFLGYGVKTSAIKQALTNPSRIRRIEDPGGRVSFRYYGKDAWVAVNEFGEIITMKATTRAGVRFK